jgi:hypothetical protein
MFAVFNFWTFKSLDLLISVQAKSMFLRNFGIEMERFSVLMLVGRKIVVAAEVDSI